MILLYFKDKLFIKIKYYEFTSINYFLSNFLQQKNCLKYKQFFALIIQLLNNIKELLIWTI